jgi:hypothetical protein
MHPYLSIVVAARNDNYGGDFLRRMHLFLSTLAALSDRHRLSAEVIIVEWNPPADRPCLGEIIDRPCNGNGLFVRIVTVAESVHRTMANSEKMPMFEYIAKNVGIRRAQGDFVLVTNPDIIFSGEAVAYLAKGGFSPDCFQKADRYDVKRIIPSDIPVDSMLRFCKRHVVRIHRWDGPWDPRVSARIWSSLALLVPAFLSRPNPLRLVRWALRSLGNQRNEKGNTARLAPGRLHLGASGDFLLIARQQWHRLRGFPELPTHSWIDNYLVHLASAAGLNQLVIPHPIYHQEHDRAEHAVRPQTVLDRLPEFSEMLATGRPVVINGPDWGMGHISLPEYEMHRLNRHAHASVSEDLMSSLS